MVEYVEVRGFHAFKNRPPAKPREPKLAAEFRHDFLRKAPAEVEEIPRSRHLERHQAAEAPVELPRAQVVERNIKPGEVFHRQVNAVAGKVHADVLPEIGEL